MNRIWLAGIAMMLVIGSAGAATWKKIGRSAGGNIYFLDISTIQRVGDLIRVKAKIEQGDLGTNSPVPQVKSMTAFHYVDCRNHAYAATQITLYGANGKPIISGRSVPLALLDFRTPEPGSFVAAVTDIVCTRNPFTEHLLSPR